MENPMKIEIISKETIKPSSPTPQNLQTFQLTFVDQLMVPTYTPILLFYPIDSDNCIDKLDIAAKSQRLKKSLSETLTHFYPVAGRVKDNTVIECNDAGVEFVEARVTGSLSDFFEKPDLDSLDKFLPIEILPSKPTNGSLLYVQTNFFDCGSLTLAVSFCHKFGDASTISTFVKCWSAIAFGDMAESMLPKYVVGTALHPSGDSSIVLPPIQIKLSPKCVTRRYVFEESKLAELKTKIASTTELKPTRVEAVTALIWKCANTASRTNLGSNTRPYLMSQSVNIRKRVSPSLPENSVGNFIGQIIVGPEEGEIDLQQLVIQMRKSLAEYSENILAHMLQDQSVFFKIYDAMNDSKLETKLDEVDFYSFTSWCRLSFYEADFGWGRPKWATLPSFTAKNSMLLMDTSDGKGIEALLSLSEQDMAVLGRNEEFIEFASLNPSIK
ncbi:hypothetical protein L6164_030738 [Bauhinia variegata]|uniref:Uncharacterized protein n=1 Tax=Bauhinia variegata TaxID=167791 RepID=A0ACB9LDL9_BAUVA|nr:hypothetical protein L6164_030738 [Bauhinia variegata]